MPTDKRYPFARDIWAHFRGAAFAVTQTMRGKRPSRTVYNLAALWSADQLTDRHIAYLLRAVDVPQLTANSYPTAAFALRTITAAMKTQSALHADIQKMAPRLLTRAVHWLDSGDEGLRAAACCFLSGILPLLDQPLPKKLARPLDIWLGALQPDDPRRAITRSLHRLNPPVLQSRFE